MINLPTTLRVLASYCGGEVIGDGGRQVRGICSIENPQSDCLTFIATAAAVKNIATLVSTMLIVKPSERDKVIDGICHDNPQQAFRKILVSLTVSSTKPVIAKTAVLATTVTFGNDISIGENSVIGDNVDLGDGCRIGSGVVIEDNARIGANTRIGHRVVIHYDTQIGDNCVISEGAVIGGQGFGFSFENGGWEAIPQIGCVSIGNRVHIGANSCIDRGAINDTVIGDNVIIDNLVHIAHNVKVGEGSAMAAGVGIAGSTTVGRHCLLAGQVGVVGHIHIADGVQVNGGARVLKSIKESGVYAGSLNAQPVRQWNRLAVYFKKLEILFK